MSVLRTIWAVLVWVFVLLIPVQFYLAGHGAMEGAHAADKNVHVMGTSWDPHVALGTIMALIAILILIFGLTAKLPRSARGNSIGLFVVMLIQYILPIFNDSSGGRAIASLHAVNALLVTGAALVLAYHSAQYLPFRVPLPGRVAASLPEESVIR